MTVVIDTPEGMLHFHMLVIRGRLSMETKGIKFRPIPGHGSTHAYVKNTYGFKGTIASGKVLTQYEAMLREKGVLR